MQARVRMVVTWTLLAGLWFATPTAASADGWKLPKLRLWPSQQEPDETRPGKRGVKQASFDDSVESRQTGFEVRSLWPAARLDIPTPTESLNAGIDTIKAGSRKLKQGATQLHSGTQRMWNSTRITLTAPFAGSPQSGPRQPSLWSQMFGSSQEEQPQTVRQFLSQERP